MSLGRRAAAELLGTFWLVFGGCGAAVLSAAFPQVGIGLLGVAFAFGLTVLTTPELDFSKGSYKPLPFASVPQLLEAFDDGAAKVRAALEAMPDKAWTEPWKLSFQGKAIFEGSRFLAYREMFLNHLVHHRAQLGVYLRLNNQPVPASYGPSADETLGF